MGHNNLRISVITPSFNQAIFLEETIKSVLTQNIKNIEYIVVDGGSHDGSIEILRKYINEIKWISESDKGQSNAINKGFELSNGEILCWLNSDDLFVDGALEFVIKYFEDNPEIDCIYGNMITIDQFGNSLLKRHEIPFDKNILLYAMNFIPQSSTFWRRKVYERIGGLSEQLHYTMDHEYWLRMEKNVIKIKHVDKFLSCYRWHDKSKGVINSNKINKERAFLRKEYANFDRLFLLEKLFYPLLNIFFRIKRQKIKYKLYKEINFLPAHFYKFYLKNIKKHFDIK